jgi:uncharacterized protein (DUF3820 family)
VKLSSTPGYFFYMDITCQRCGSVNDYHVVKTELHDTAYCNGCDAYIKHLPKNNPIVIMPFGKYKGREISSLLSDEELRYVTWMLHNSTANEKIKTALKNHLQSC